MGQNLLRVPFVRDVMTLQAGTVVTTGLSLINSVLLARLLGLGNFGLYATTLAFTSTLILLTQWGQSQASLTFFAESYSNKDRRGMCQVLRYYLLLSGAAALVTAVFIAVTPWLSQLLYQEDRLGKIAQIALLANLAGSFNPIFPTLLQCVRRVKVMTMLENLRHLTQVLASATFVLLGLGVRGAFLGILISNLVILSFYILTYLRFRTHDNLPSFYEALRSREPIRPLLKQGALISIDKNIANWFPQNILLLMSIFGSKNLVGIAQLAYNVGSLPTALFLPQAIRMATTVLPAISAQGAQALRKTCAKLIKHAIAIHSLITLGGFLVLPFILILFYGMDYRAAILPMLWIIAIRLESGINVVNSPLLRFKRKNHIPVLLYAIELPVQFLVFLSLIQIFSPLTVFVVNVGIRQLFATWITWYVYRYLIK